MKLGLITSGRDLKHCEETEPWTPTKDQLVYNWIAGLCQFEKVFLLRFLLVRRFPAYFPGKGYLPGKVKIIT